MFSGGIEKQHRAVMGYSCTFPSCKQLKVQSCKLHNNKYMITSTQITNTEIFRFITDLDFRLLSRKVLFTNRKDNRNCSKVSYFFKKIANLVNYCKILNSWKISFIRASAMTISDLL